MLAQPDSQPHQYYMQRALQLARRGMFTTKPNPSVGCVIVKDNRVVSSGFHQFQGSAHAEVDALQKLESAKEATLYCTLEPCAHHGHTPPCSDAIIDRGVKRLHVGMLDPSPSLRGKSLAGLGAGGGFGYDRIPPTGFCRAKPWLY